jgi:hypothetical protein
MVGGNAAGSLNTSQISSVVGKTMGGGQPSNAPSGTVSPTGNAQLFIPQEMMASGGTGVA